MRTRRRQGYLLMECMAYIALLAVFLVVTMRGFYRCWDNSKALRHNADDIITVLHAGEQWRADLRAARGPILMTNNGGWEEFHIPSVHGEIIYQWLDGEVWRQSSVPSANHLLLKNVRSSAMQSRAVAGVTAWTWELELKPGQKQIHVVPLFTFEAVSGPLKKP